MTRFRIRMDGKTVAGAEGPNAEAQIMHYAAQYRQDGEVTIQHNAQGHWKPWALPCQWPMPEGGAVRSAVLPRAARSHQRSPCQDRKG